MENNTREMLFSSDLNPWETESLFQKSRISSNIGDVIPAIKSSAFFVNFNFWTKTKLKTLKTMIKIEHGFLKIIAIAMKHKKVLNILLKFFSEIFIIQCKIN